MRIRELGGLHDHDRDREKETNRVYVWGLMPPHSRAVEAPESCSTLPGGDAQGSALPAEPVGRSPSENGWFNHGENMCIMAHTLLYVGNIRSYVIGPLKSPPPSANLKSLTPRSNTLGRGLYGK